MWYSAVGSIVILLLSLLVVPLTVEAQPPGKVYRIGYISPGAGPGVLTETFRQGLRDLGYVEGQNLMIEYRWTESGDRLPELMGELVGLKPDLIVTVSHRVSLEAKRATPTIPIVFAHVNDPVGVGLVPSLGHPQRERHRPVGPRARPHRQAARAVKGVRPVRVARRLPRQSR